MTSSLKMLPVLLLFFFSGCSLGEPPVQDPAVVAKEIGLELPGSVSEVRAHAEGFQDWIYQLEFEVSQEDHKELAAQLQIVLSAEGDQPYFASDWWTPTNKAPVSWGSKQTHGPNRQRSMMVFPASREDRYWVRIEVFDF